MLAAVFRGADALYEVSLGDALTLHAMVPNARGRRLFQRGDAVQATCGPTDVLLLPSP